MKHRLLLYVRHHLCPSLSVSLHLLCISLLPCRKKHNSFVVYSSQSGSELGVVSCFLCSPRQYGLGPSSPVRFPKIMCSSRKRKTVIPIMSLLPLSLSYTYVADFQLWVIIQLQSHAKGQDFDENNVTQGLHRHYRERSSVGIWLTASMTAAR